MDKILFKHKTQRFPPFKHFVIPIATTWLLILLGISFSIIGGYKIFKEQDFSAGNLVAAFGGLICLIAGIFSIINAMKFILFPFRSYTFTKKELIIETRFNNKKIPLTKFIKDLWVEGTAQTGTILLKYRDLRKYITRVIIPGLEQPYRVANTIKQILLYSKIESDIEFTNDINEILKTLIGKDSVKIAFESRRQQKLIVTLIQFFFSLVWVGFALIMTIGLILAALSQLDNIWIYLSIIHMLLHVFFGGYLFKISVGELFRRKINYKATVLGLFIKYSNSIRFISWKEFTGWIQTKGESIFMNGPVMRISRGVLRERIRMIGVKDPQKISRELRKCIKTYKK